MAFTFPLCFYVLRHVINIFIFEGIRGDYQSVQEMSTTRFLLLTLPPLAIVLGIGCFVKDLGFVLSLAGGVGGTGLAFIMPPLCFIKLHKDSLCVWRNGDRMWQSARELYPAVLFIVFGLVVGIGSAYQTLSSL
jgi:sodium-coupled neutral amino acid transporter 11